MRYWILLALTILMLTVVAAQDDDEEPTFEEAIEAIVADVPNILSVLDITIVENRDVVILEIMYVTGEIEEFGYRAELMDVFRSVGTHLMEEESEIDEVLLIPSITEDINIEFVAVEAPILFEFVQEEINRSDLIREMDVSFAKDLEPEESEEL